MRLLWSLSLPPPLSSLRQYMVTLKTEGRSAPEMLMLQIGAWCFPVRRRAQSVIHNAATEGGGDEDRNNNKQTNLRHKRHHGNRLLSNCDEPPFFACSYSNHWQPQQEQDSIRKDERDRLRGGQRETMPERKVRETIQGKGRHTSQKKDRFPNKNRCKHFSAPRSFLEMPSCSQTRHS